MPMNRTLIAAALACASCSLANSFISGAESSAGSTLGARAANEVVGPAPQAQPAVAFDSGSTSAAMYSNPVFLGIYMNMIFSMAFSSGGYDVAQVAYKPGDYTRWSASEGNGKAATLERAYLFDDKNGNQWWKVKWTDEKNETVVLEGLLSPSEKRFLRMRGKFPNDAAGKELALDEHSYYRPPQHLSKESVEGATTGVENITVPAGSFKAKHVVFGGVGGTSEWWLAEKVPGGSVRQLAQGENSKNAWEMKLEAYGSDAKSELGAK